MFKYRIVANKLQYPLPAVDREAAFRSRLFRTRIRPLNAISTDRSNPIRAHVDRLRVADDRVAVGSIEPVRLEQRVRPEIDGRRPKRPRLVRDLTAVQPVPLGIEPVVLDEERVERSLSSAARLARRLVGRVEPCVNAGVSPAAGEPNGPPALSERLGGRGVRHVHLRAVVREREQPPREFDADPVVRVEVVEVHARTVGPRRRTSGG